MIAGTTQSNIARAMERAFAGAPPLFEVTAAQGGGTAKGALLALHGGAWVLVGEGAVRSMRDVAERWATAGWDVLNVDYRPGGASLDDAATAWAALRDAVGPEVPRAMYGKSAGGQLALMVAASQRDAAAVVAESAPTMLYRLASDPAAGARNVGALAAQSFGATRAALDAVSPAAPDAARALNARVLIAAAATDVVVPPSQARLLQAARPDLVQAMILAPGSRDFVHAGVSDAAWDTFLGAESALRDSISRAR